MCRRFSCVSWRTFADKSRITLSTCESGVVLENMLKPATSSRITGITESEKRDQLVI